MNSKIVLFIGLTCFISGCLSAAVGSIDNEIKIKELAIKIDLALAEGGKSVGLAWGQVGKAMTQERIKIHSKQQDIRETIRNARSKAADEAQKAKVDQCAATEQASMDKVDFNELNKCLADFNLAEMSRKLGDFSDLRVKLYDNVKICKKSQNPDECIKKELDDDEKALDTLKNELNTDVDTAVKTAEACIGKNGDVVVKNIDQILDDLKKCLA